MRLEAYKELCSDAIVMLHDKHCKNQSVYELLYLYKLCHVTSNICNEFLKERLVVSAWTKGPVGNTNGPWVTTATVKEEW